METSPLICSPNQWTGFYMITASVMKELTGLQKLYFKNVWYVMFAFSYNIKVLLRTLKWISWRRLFKLHGQDVLNFGLCFLKFIQYTTLSYNRDKTNRSSPSEVLLGKDVLKICNKFTGELWSCFATLSNHTWAWVFMAVLSSFYC